jgi:hypothetical protein
VITDKLSFTSSILSPKFLLKCPCLTLLCNDSSNPAVAGTVSNASSLLLKRLRTSVCANYFHCLGHRIHPSNFCTYFWHSFYIKLYGFTSQKIIFIILTSTSNLRTNKSVDLRKQCFTCCLNPLRWNVVEASRIFSRFWISWKLDSVSNNSVLWLFVAVKNDRPPHLCSWEPFPPF